MVEPHVAGPASLRLAGFLDGKEMPSVAGIARSDAKPRPLCLQLPNLFLCLQPDLVAAAAAFHPLDQDHRLPVGGRHGFHCRPGQGVLSSLELLDLDVVARGAGLWCGDLHLGHILRRRVLIPVADRAINPALAVLAQSPVGNNTGRDFFVATRAILRDCRQNNEQGHQKTKNCSRGHGLTSYSRLNQQRLCRRLTKSRSPGRAGLHKLFSCFPL